VATQVPAGVVSQAPTHPLLLLLPPQHHLTSLCLQQTDQVAAADTRLLLLGPVCWVWIRWALCHCCACCCPCPLSLLLPQSLLPGCCLPPSLLLLRQLKVPGCLRALPLPTCCPRGV
jgi:hypothetical protein